MTPSAEPLVYREGGHGDLRTTFGISARAVYDTAKRMGILDGAPPTPDQIEAEWRLQREVVDFLARQPDGSYWVCEDAGEVVGYARVCRFEALEQLTELMVMPSHHGRGIGRELFERCFPTAPEPGRPRLVVAAGATVDLSLYSGFGLMPIAGHWHVRATLAAYLAARAREAADGGPAVEALDPAAAADAWRRLEPAAIGCSRPSLHDFLARTRTCLAALGGPGGEPSALCWLGPGGDVGPAVAREPDDLVPVVVAALDRVARTRAPQLLGVYCTSDAWPLLARLRGVGFRVHWPGFVMGSSRPPGLDRYLAMRPPHLL